MFILVIKDNQMELNLVYLYTYAIGLIVIIKYELQLIDLYWRTLAGTS